MTIILKKKPMTDVAAVKQSNMPVLKVWRGEDWLLDFSRAPRVAKLYTSFMMCHTALKNHKIIIVFGQYPFI